MRIGGEFNEVRIEFGEADKDGDVRVRVEIDFNSRREYFFVSQEELKELIIHLQKQLRRQSDNNPWNNTTPTTADCIDTYEGMQTQRNEYAKVARIAERNGEQEEADRARAEVKFLNKELREIHRNRFYKAQKGTVTGSRR